MRTTCLIYLLGLCVYSLALPDIRRTTHVLHEKRASSSRWKRTTRVHPDAIIPLRIGLTQTNLENGHDLLMGVSHPSSPNYGKYLSAGDVHELFAPAEHVVQAIKDWLIQENVNSSDIEQSQNKGWLAVDLPARDVERLFLAEYHVLENLSGDLVSVGCDEYSVPTHLAEHIDYIRPGVKISAPLKKRRPESRRRRSIARKRSDQPLSVLRERASLLEQAEASGAVSVGELCSNHSNVELSCIKALYQIPQGHLSTPGYELGIFEQGSYFDADDLTIFYATYAPWVPNGTVPKVESIDGGEAPINCRNGDPNYKCGEADIDFQLAISLVYPQEVINYQVDDAYYAPKEVAKDNTFNTFLDALDGSYCSYTAYGITGDSPGIDPKYPDPHKKGYHGQRQCGTVTPTKVISISYGESEEDFPANYARRQCNEFMKLSLQGHSIFISSGDYGVGQPPIDPAPNGCLSNAKEGLNGTIFNPSYPADCPYITSVGGTMLPPNNRTGLEEWTMHIPYVTTHFSSGGGFSNFYPAPGYQKAAVDTFFSSYDPGYPYYYANAAGTNYGANGGIYARSGRGYPDVSAFGSWVPAPDGGVFYHNFGTSLSSPIFASVITLINLERAQAGKGPVGFVNPVLYENAGVLNDVTKGRNTNCGTQGFFAEPGWDPTTGLGTPNYPKMLEMFMSLP